VSPGGGGATLVAHVLESQTGLVYVRAGLTRSPTLRIRFSNQTPSRVGGALQTRFESHTGGLPEARGTRHRPEPLPGGNVSTLVAYDPVNKRSAGVYQWATAGWGTLSTASNLLFQVAAGWAADRFLGGQGRRASELPTGLHNAWAADYFCHRRQAIHRAKWAARAACRALALPTPAHHLGVEASVVGIWPRWQGHAVRHGAPNVPGFRRIHIDSKARTTLDRMQHSLITSSASCFKVRPYAAPLRASSEGRIRSSDAATPQEEVCQLRRHPRELRMLVEHVRHPRILCAKNSSAPLPNAAPPAFLDCSPAAPCVARP